MKYLKHVMVFLFSASLSLAISAAPEDADQKAVLEKQAEILVPSSERGDHYKTNSAILEIYRLKDAAKTTEYCVPAGSTFRIGVSQESGMIALSVVSLPIRTKSNKVYGKVHDGNIIRRMCKGIDGRDVPWADFEYAYMVSAKNLASHDFRRTGWTFGALVVPFKYYVGDDKKITSSTTVAPYVGYAYNNWRGMNLAVVGSAGLALVPISDSTNGSTETKPAFSVATGLLFSSQKNSSWSAGFLFGKDFIGDADKARDPAANDPWISLFIGTSFN